jgi:spore germination protein
MIWRRRTVAVVILVLLATAGVLAGRGVEVAGAARAAVTLDGQALEPGTREVAPRPSLGLLLPPGSRSGDFHAALDGRAVTVTPGEGRTARLEVGELLQGSHHRLEVWRGGLGPARVAAVSVEFQVTDPLQLAASWLASATQTTVQVSASRELVDVGPVQAALTRAGAAVRRDDRGIEGRWPAGRTPAFTVPAGLRATTGAFLPVDFSATLAPTGGSVFSRVDLSTPPGPRPTGLRLRAYYVAGPAARADLLRHVARISVLSPSFYAADGDGTLVRNLDEAALATTRAAGVAVEPLVTNRDFSAEAARQLFRSPGSADSLATSLIAEAGKRAYAGYQLDFEGLGFGDRAALSAFSGGLARRLRSAGLQYSVAVIPTKDTSGSGLAQLFGHSGVYDYAQLSRDTSSMSLMAYDQHTSSTDPGPIAGLDWLRGVTRASTSGLDRSRIYMGVPLYFRDWQLRGAPVAGAYEDLLASAAAHDGTVSWDFASVSPYVRYSGSGDEHVAWVENRTSLLAKLQLAREMGFGGIAAWRLGLEDPTWWDLW